MSKIEAREAAGQETAEPGNIRRLSRRERTENALVDAATAAAIRFVLDPCDPVATTRSRFSMCAQSRPTASEFWMAPSRSMRARSGEPTVW